MWLSSVQSLSHFVTPWTAAHQASLSITNSWSLLKLMSIESVMPSNHLIIYRPLLLLPSIFPSIRIFSNESVLHIRWPKYWSFSFSISPSNEYSGLTSFRILLLRFKCPNQQKTTRYTKKQKLWLVQSKKINQQKQSAEKKDSGSIRKRLYANCLKDALQNQRTMWKK